MPLSPAPATYSLLVNGVEMMQYLEQTTWTISQHFTRQGDTAKFTLIDDRSATGSASPTFVPKSLQSVVFTDTSTSTVLFSGLVTTPTFTRNGPLQTRWSLDCRDWTYIADTTIVAGDFLGLSADTIVKSLIAQANSGISAGNIQTAPTINRVQINYQTLSAAMTTLAKLASQSTDYGWYIDENRQVQFFAQNQAPAPTVTLTDGTPALPTATLGRYEEQGFNYVWDGTTVRSSAIVRGATYPGNRTDLWLGDGSTTQWSMSFPLNTSGAAPEFRLSGALTPITVLTGGASAPAGSGFLLTQSLAGVWVLQTYGGRAAPGAGVEIFLRYPYQAPVIARTDDASFQSTYSALPNKGVFQMYVSDSSLVTLSTAQNRGFAELQQYGLIQERVTLKTSAGFPGHIKAGDQFTLVTSFVPNSQAGYAAGFTANFICLAATIQGVQSGYRTYQLSGTRVS